jgi:hypothetical protein
MAPAAGHKWAELPPQFLIGLALPKLPAPPSVFEARRLFAGSIPIGTAQARGRNIFILQRVSLLWGRRLSTLKGQVLSTPESIILIDFLLLLRLLSLNRVAHCHDNHITIKDFGSSPSYCDNSPYQTARGPAYPRGGTVLSRF